MSLISGPYVHLQSAFDQTHQWKLSLAYVTSIDGSVEPRFELDGKVYTTALQTVHKIVDVLFHITHLQIPRTKEVRRLSYRVADKKYSVSIPGTETPLRIAYFSCNGVPYGKDRDPDLSIKPLWRDMNKTHALQPFHVLVGGGDQIYCDGVFEVSSLKKWRAKPREVRLNAPFTNKMRRQVEKYYLQHYIDHFNTPHFRRALAEIPSVMSWDDHDIFDGWGSYNVEDQQCPVFQGIYSVAKEFYGLFQQQMDRTLLTMKQVNGALHEIRQFGTTALLTVDTRSERSIYQVVSRESWNHLLEKLNALTAETKHLIVSLAVPILYPSFRLAELFMEALDGAQRSALGRRLRGKAGETVTESPELLDDLRDHWKADGHEQERKWIIEQLRNFAEKRRVRVTFLSGDVHCASFAHRYNSLRKHSRDPDYMVQITSSAIGYTPPPSPMSSLLQIFSLVEQLVSIRNKLKEGLTSADNSEELVFIRRNWCEIDEKDLSLQATLHTEVGNDVLRYVKTIEELKQRRFLENTRQKLSLSFCCGS